MSFRKRRASCGEAARGAGNSLDNFDGRETGVSLAREVPLLVGRTDSAAKSHIRLALRGKNSDVGCLARNRFTAECDTLSLESNWNSEDFQTRFESRAARDKSFRQNRSLRIQERFVVFGRLGALLRGYVRDESMFT